MSWEIMGGSDRAQLAAEGIHSLIDYSLIDYLKGEYKMGEEVKKHRLGVRQR